MCCQQRPVQRPKQDNLFGGSRKQRMIANLTAKRPCRRTELLKRRKGLVENVGLLPRVDTVSAMLCHNTVGRSTAAHLWPFVSTPRKRREHSHARPQRHAFWLRDHRDDESNGARCTRRPLLVDQRGPQVTRGFARALSSFSRATYAGTMRAMMSDAAVPGARVASRTWMHAETWLNSVSDDPCISYPIFRHTNT